MVRGPERLGELAFKESFDTQLNSVQRRISTAKRKLNAAQVVALPEGVLLFNSEEYASLVGLAFIAFATWMVHSGADEVKEDIQEVQKGYNEAYSQTPSPHIIPIGRQAPDEKLTNETFVVGTTGQLRQTRERAGTTHFAAASTRWFTLIEGGYLAVSGDFKEFVGIAAIAVLSHLATRDLSAAKSGISHAHTRFLNAGTKTLLDRGIGRKEPSMVK